MARKMELIYADADVHGVYRRQLLAWPSTRQKSTSIGQNFETYLLQPAVRRN